MPTAHKPYQGFAQEMTYPEYVLLTDMPYMWYSSDATKNYKKYYRKSGNNYALIDDATAPNFASEDFYVLFNSQPSYTNPELHRFVDGDKIPDGQILKFKVAGTDSYRYIETEDYYILTTEEPDDWETNYTDYLYKDGDQYKYVTGISAPPWTANTYYKVSDNYTLTMVKPSDWKTNYRRYFYKDGGTYVRVSGDSAPPWESNKYYVCNEIP